MAGILIFLSAMPGHLYSHSPALILVVVGKCEIMHQWFVTTAPMGLGIAETYLSRHTASPSLLSIMRRAAWGGGKPVHISASPGYACENTVSRRQQPNHIHIHVIRPDIVGTYRYWAPKYESRPTDRNSWYIWIPIFRFCQKLKLVFQSLQTLALSKFTTGSGNRTLLVFRNR